MIINNNKTETEATRKKQEFEAVTFTKKQKIVSHLKITFLDNNSLIFLSVDAIHLQCDFNSRSISFSSFLQLASLSDLKGLLEGKS